MFLTNASMKTVQLFGLPNTSLEEDLLTKVFFFLKSLTDAVVFAVLL